MSPSAPTRDRPSIRTARQRRVLVALTAVLSAAAVLLGLAAPAGAGTLSPVSWAVSKPHPGDTAVRYSWMVTPATTATLSSLTFTVPAGTGGAALSVADVYGLPAGGAVGLSGTTVTYTLPTPTSVAAGIRILVAVDGFTNTATAGSYPSTITTYSGATAVDSAATPPVAIDAGQVAVTTVIARSTSFAMDNRVLRNVRDPSSASNNFPGSEIGLTVKTNAAGYLLTARATPLANTAGTQAIAPVSSGVAAPVSDANFGFNRWGYTLAAAPAVAGTAALELPVGSWAGYSTADEAVARVTGATNTDTFSLRTRVRVDYLQPADTYRSTITYTIVPLY